MVGRKPLVVVRAVILGLLMPASGDPRKDRETFLALLTMDEEGLRRRKSRNIPLKEVYRRLADDERPRWFTRTSTAEKPKLKATKAAAKREARAQLQALLFERMSYDEKLRWCDRPEHLAGPSPEAWQRINAHLGIQADSLPALVRELGERRFGRVPRVGDAFCGGGSVPFEAARIGCAAYGSDLNPVAALLTWGALNIVVGGKAVASEVRRAQQAVFEAVDAQVTSGASNTTTTAGARTPSSIARKRRARSAAGGFPWRRVGSSAKKRAPSPACARTPSANASTSTSTKAKAARR